jgi:hypothetical protein
VCVVTKIANFCVTWNSEKDPNIRHKLQTKLILVKLWFTSPFEVNMISRRILVSQRSDVALFTRNTTVSNILTANLNKTSREILQWHFLVSVCVEKKEGEFGAENETLKNHTSCNIWRSIAATVSTILRLRCCKSRGIGGMYPRAHYATWFTVCGRNFITRLTSAASPRVDISSTCKVGQKLGVSLPLLICSLRRDLPGYCTAEVWNPGGTYESPCIILNYLKGMMSCLTV